MTRIPQSDLIRSVLFHAHEITVEAPTARHSKTYVYALCNPLNETVRHVGISVDPKRRYYQHVSAAKNRYATTMLGAWINKLASSGLKPSLRILEIIDGIVKNQEDEWQCRYADTLYTSGRAILGGFSLQWNYSSEQELSRRDELIRIELGCRVAEHFRTQSSDIVLRITPTTVRVWVVGHDIRTFRDTFWRNLYIKQPSCECCQQSRYTTDKASW